MSTATALTLTREFRPVECCQCAIEFWVPDQWANKRHQDHEWWYCPNGHQQHWSGPSRAEIAERKLAESERSLQWERKRIEKLERDAKKLKRRIANGVCPCCQRTFGNLAAHMKTKHPDYSQAKQAT